MQAAMVIEPGAEAARAKVATAVETLKAVGRSEEMRKEMRGTARVVAALPEVARAVLAWE